MERLSLHQLAALRATPSELIEIAARLSCPTVTLFATKSDKSTANYVKTLAEARQLRRQAETLGVGIYSLEVFSLNENGLTDTLRAGLEIGAELGGKRATVCIYDADIDRARDNFDAFNTLATEHGISVHVEFHAFGVLNTLPATREFLAGTSTTASVSADVLHFYRNEGSLDSLAQSHPVPVGHAQLCDGPLLRAKEEWLYEAVHDRLIPGHGEFDIVKFLRLLPSDVRIDLEIPTTASKSTDISNLEQCEKVLTAARRLLEIASQSTDATAPTQHDR